MRQIKVIVLAVCSLAILRAAEPNIALAETHCDSPIQGINLSANTPIDASLLATIRAGIAKGCATPAYLRRVSAIVESAVTKSGLRLQALDLFQANTQFLQVDFQTQGGTDDVYTGALTLRDTIDAPIISMADILGDAVENQIVTFRYVLTGDAAIDPSLRLGLKWLRNGVPIAGATTSRYRLRKNDIGATITGELTIYDAENAVLESRRGDLAMLVAAAEYPPEIKGLTIVGKSETGTVLRAEYMFVDENVGDVEGATEFIWLRDNYAIPGANGPTYTITTEDIGKTIGVRVIPRADDGVAGAARTYAMRDAVIAKPITIDPALLDKTPSIIANGKAVPLGDKLPIAKPTPDDRGLSGSEITDIIIQSVESSAEKTVDIDQPAPPKAPAPTKEGEPSISAPVLADIILAEGLSLDPNATTKVTRLDFSKSSVFDDPMLAAIAAPFIGEEVSVELIRQMIERVGERYLEEGYELSRALLPEQRIVDGVVKIRLVEARVGKIVLENIERLNPKFIRKFLNIREGDLLSLSRLERYIRLYNATNKSNMTSELAPGEEFGETDVFLTMQEPDRVELPTLSINNYASEVTDWRQQSASVTFNNLLGYDDELFVSYNDSNGSESTTVNLGFPIGSEGMNMSVGRSESNTIYTNDGAGASGIIGTRGAANSDSVSLSMPLIFDDDYSIYASAAYGSSYSEVTLANSGLNLTESRVRKLEVAFPMNYGNAVSNFSFSPNFAVLNSSTNSPTFASRSEKWLSRMKADISASRYINKYATFNLRSNIVYTDAKDMLNYPSELLSIGGPSSVRAYQPSVSAGHQGYFVSLELRSDLANWENITLPKLIPYVQPYGFIDHAFAQSRQRRTQRDNFWSGAGIGVAVPSIANIFTFDAYWATPLDTSVHKAQREAYEDEMFQFSLSAKFRLP